MDFPGLWQHFTIPVSKLDEDVFEDGLGFDGSSIRGWQAINESDMLVVPQPETAFLDPFTDAAHAGDDLQHPGPDHARGLLARSAQRRPQGGQLPEEHRHRRHLLHRARGRVLHLRRRALRPERRTKATTTSTASKASGTAAATKSPNLGYKLRYKEGYFPVPPADQLMNIRNEMMQTMIDCGLDVEAQHHEVATGGQSEIDLRFHDLVRMADKMMIYKYIIKNVATQHNKTVTFMPKPLFGDNGSGMHTHISLWKGGNPLFAGSGYAGLSEMAMHAIGGLLQARPGDPGVFATRRPTATSGWCRATRRRSTWPTRSAIARPAAAFRCTAPAPRPSASSSAAPIRAAIRTWPSRPC